MLIQIDLPSEAALNLAHAQLNISVVGPIHGECFASIETVGGEHIFSVSMPDVLPTEFKQELELMVDNIKELVNSTRWDGRGLTIRMDNAVSVTQATPAQALGLINKSN